MFTWAAASFLAVALIVPVSHETTVANAAKTAVWVGIRVHDIPSEEYKQMTADSEDGAAKETTVEDGGECSGFVAEDVRPDVQPGWISNVPDELLIVTAAHCDGDEHLSFLGIDLGEVVTTPTDVHFYDGQVADVSGVYKDPVADVAILRVHMYNHHEPVAYARKAAPFGGEKLFDWGSPENQYFTYTDATAMGQTLNPKIIGADDDDSQKFLAKEAGDWLVECASCAPGISGSPMFDQHGHVVGIYVANLDAGLGMIVPGPTVLRTLQTAKFK